MCTICVPGTLGSQKRALGPPGTGVTGGYELLSTKALSALSHRALASVPKQLIFKDNV